MHYKSLIILLVMAVSFQSIAAVSDVHQSHQSGAELLELEYEDQSDRNSQNDTSFKEYQHCCSCHGVSCCYLENKQEYFEPYFRPSELIEKRSQITSRISPPNFRPPIV